MHKAANAESRIVRVVREAEGLGNVGALDIEEQRSARERPRRAAYRMSSVWRRAPRTGCDRLLARWRRYERSRFPEMRRATSPRR